VFPLWPGSNIIVAQFNYNIFVYKYNLFIFNVSCETFFVNNYLVISLF